MRRARQPRRRKRAAARGFAVALAHLLLALAVLCGVARSGSQYYYCEAFGLSLVDPCFHEMCGDDSGPAGQVLHEQRPDCCEIIRLPAMPQAARGADPNVVPAGCVAILAAPSCDDVPSKSSHSSGMALFERWRPPPRASRESRAQRMVFLT